jgi:hypothetical protein
MARRALEAYTGPVTHCPPGAARGHEKDQPAYTVPNRIAWQSLLAVALGL